ncbi:hypothetical protein CCR85_10165 [Rhodothalassium salexigens]|uniref:YccF domain-containing protein n=1 Tax=Rhodothalassium salexigens TaxID=1086 RepID=UPI001912F26D|nr:YccF domain-containing protein [Rhodothalassium salexigens]MBK5911852.1 hypothetical protein [Rhodothalassium salexigens]
MALILNVLWLLLGGLMSALGWWAAALVFAVTIVGLPWAAAAFRLGLYSLWPFGTEAVDRAVVDAHGFGVRAFNPLLNLVWFLVAGWWLALGHLAWAFLCAITIIGLPFAYAHIKLAGAALFPVGKTIVRTA